ncbi:MAG: hydroxymethylglutaryl-CoA synthase [Pseudomonadota bacterium]
MTAVQSPAQPVSRIGISALSCYVPAYEVQLEDWCRWREDNWSKVAQVVGNSFRMRGPNENAYTMAATAVLKLIRDHDVDPAQIGFLGLGTESSTDNSAGAVIVKGMVNQALSAQGHVPIARACEVPEFKHACLGGVYAMKAAVRYLATDGADRVAIVVCADVAEYERSTSGEPTQGAGAVAMLIEPEARIATINLRTTGSASDYRGVDFRKPFLRFMQQAPSELAQPRDFPVFNGKYSTSCYVDEVLAAMRDLFRRLPGSPATFLRNQGAIFLHRPYQRMAETGLSISYLLALALGDEADQAELAGYAAAAEVDPAALKTELIEEHPDLGPAPEVVDSHPLATQTARVFRSTETFQQLMTRLGTGPVGRVGNLYTASLPLWLAAGLEEAAAEDLPLGDQLLTIGYGSGDAAEVIPLELVPGWQAAARRSAVADALEHAIAIDQDTYEALHEGRQPDTLGEVAVDRFVIDRIGARNAGINDLGIEYYRYDSA